MLLQLALLLLLAPAPAPAQEPAPGSDYIIRSGVGHAPPAAHSHASSAGSPAPSCSCSRSCSGTSTWIGLYNPIWGRARPTCSSLSCFFSWLSCSFLLLLPLLLRNQHLDRIMNTHWGRSGTLHLQLTLRP